MNEETLFAEALKYSDARQRAAYLRRACAGDESLLARVNELLEMHEEAGSFLKNPAVMAQTIAGDTQARLAEKPGDVIGRYKLLQQIGEGGFGVVFMAQQEQPVRRRVALKVIRLGMDTNHVIARFEAERQALAMMDHPNIAKVHDAGATDSGRPYFVMELVSGVPITEFCDANNLSTRDRLGLFVQVCQAVQHAHQKGIIHRDIKPSNVLVTMHDDKPVPKVIDFGIAKATAARLTEKTLFTEFKQFIGTPQYTSPEQAQMSGLDVDTRADVYSLGVLLYEILTGTTPLDPKELRSAAFDQMQRMICEAEPQKPSTRLSSLGETLASVAAHRKTDPKKLPRMVRGELDWIVMRCLEKDRARRYDTASALAADLNRHLAGETVLARPATAAYRLKKFILRHRVVAAAITAVLLALILGAIGTGVGFVKARWAEKQAVLDRNDAVSQKLRAEEAGRSLEGANQTLKQRSAELQHALHTSTMGYIQAAIKNDDIKRARELLGKVSADQRGFEWAILNWHTDRSIDTVTIPAAGMYSAFSSDGARGVTADRNGLVTVWDARAQKPLRSWQAYPPDSGPEYITGGGRMRGSAIGSINWCARDERIITTSGGALPAKLWDAPTGHLIKELEGPSAQMQSIVLLPDGLRMLAIPTDENVTHPPRVWDMNTGAVLLTLKLSEGLPSPPTSLPVSANGEWAASGEHQQAAVWNLRSGELVSTFKLPPETYVSMISQDGRQLLVRGTSWKIVDAKTGAEIRDLGAIKEDQGFTLTREFENHPVGTARGIKIMQNGVERHLLAPAGISHMRLSEDGRQLIAQGGGVRRVWDISGDEYFTIRGVTDGMLGFSPDGRLLAIRELFSGVGHQFDIPGTQVLLFRSHNVHARVTWLDAQTGQRTRSVNCGTNVVDGPHYDGKRIVVLEKDDGEMPLERFCTVRVFDPESGREIAAVRKLPGAGDTVAISPDGKRVAVSRWWWGEYPFQTALNVIDLETGAIGPSLQGPGGTAEDLVFSPDGNYLAAKSTDEWALINVSTGRRVMLSRTISQMVPCFSSDSSLMVWSSWQKTSVTESATGKTVAEFRGECSGATFSPDGRRLLTSSDAGITIYDVRGFNELASLPMAAWTMSFSPDGQRLAVAIPYNLRVAILDCREPEASLRAQRDTLRIAQTAAELVNNLRDPPNGVRPDDEVKEAIEKDQSLDPAVRIAALEAIKTPREGAADKLKVAAYEFRHTPQSRNPARLERARKMLQTAVRLAPEDAEALRLLGEVQYWSGDFAAAEKTLTRAGEMYAGPDKRIDPNNEAFMAMTMSKMGRNDEAQKRLAVALAQPKQANWDSALLQNPILLQAEHMIHGIDLSEYAALFQSAEKESRLAPLMEELFDRRVLRLGEGHPAVSRSAYALASMHEELGRPERSRELYARAYRSAAMGNDGARRRETLETLIKFSQIHGTAADLAAISQVAQNLRQTSGNAARDDLDILLLPLSRMLDRAGKLDETIACRRELLELREKTAGVAAAKTLEAVEALARSLARKNNGSAENMLLAQLEKMTVKDEMGLWVSERLMANLRDVVRAAGRADDANNWEAKRKTTQLTQISLEIKRLDDTLAKTPWDSAALAWRGYARARLGMVKEAADDYDLALRLDPRDHWHWYYQGCLLAYLGEKSRYAEHCAAMLERYGDSKVNTIAERTAKACLLLPGFDTARLSAMADLAIASNDSNLGPWFVIARGMADYRAGRFEACIAQMTAARSLPSESAQATADAFIAMSQRRLGRDASEAICRAEQLAARLGKAGVDDLSAGGLENWLIAMTALREAREVPGR